MAAFVLALRAERKEIREVRAETASNNAVLPGADVPSTEAPRELLAAWMHFLREDIGEAVNVLNNRLNVISHAASAGAADDISPALREVLDRVRSECERATKITTGLLHRVNTLAPDTVPTVVYEFDGSELPPGKILVVEDDDANRKIVRKLFERLGHSVEAVSNGLEAFDEISSGGIDCIISDVRLPFANGRTLYEQVEQHAPQMASRFVFVTGDYTNPPTRTFLESTGQPYIGKPYELEALLGAVAAILRKSNRVG